MPISEERKQYLMNYTKENYKRIPLNVSYDKYAEIKSMSEKQGTSVNGYIKRAIDNQLDQDKNQVKPN